MKQTKLCKNCGELFTKKDNYSKKYWQSAKYCSVSCGRQQNNPRKPTPNKMEEKDGLLNLYIESKGETYTAIFDIDIFKKVPRIKTHRVGINKNGYPTINVLKKGKHTNIAIHKFIFPAKEGYDIDHINRNPLDNRLANLRHLSHQDNIRNQKVRNQFGVPGIRKTKWGYSVRIRPEKYKQKTIGTFKTLDEAKRARKEAELYYWGKTFIL